MILAGWNFKFIPWAMSKFSIIAAGPKGEDHSKDAAFLENR